VTPRDPQSRTDKYRILKAALWPGNHVMRWQLQHGLAPRAFALLETVGRRTGQPCHTCVGNGLIGDTFWLVAAHGQQADWVRNISKEPRVRVLVNHRWRSGIATDHRRGIRAGALARATVCRWSRAVAHT